MNLVAHEVQDLRELAMSCVNTITNMSYFLAHVKDQELRSIIERHFPLHIQDYNIKVEYLTKESGTTMRLPSLDFNTSLQSFSISPVGSYSSLTPRTEVKDFNDQEMATAYLLTLKRAGREYAWSAMEASHPDVRKFLVDAFRMACSHAYDVWQWMVKNGYYPVETAPDRDLSIMSQMYQTVVQTSSLKQ